MGFDSDKEPRNQRAPNPAFAEMHKPLNSVSSETETLFVNKNLLDSSSEEQDGDDESKHVSLNRSDDADLNDIDAEDKQGNHDAPGEVQQDVQHAAKPPLRKKLNVAIKAHKKLEK